MIIGLFLILALLFITLHAEEKIIDPDEEEKKRVLPQPFKNIPSVNFVAIENDRKDKLVIFYDSENMKDEDKQVFAELDEIAFDLEKQYGLPIMVVDKKASASNARIFEHPSMKRELPVVYGFSIADGIAEHMDASKKFTMENIKEYLQEKFVEPDFSTLIQFKSEEDMLDLYQEDGGKVHHVFLFRKENEDYSESALRAVGKFLRHYNEGGDRVPYKLRFFDVLCEFTGDHSFEMSIENRYEHNRYVRSYCNRLGIEGFPIVMMLADGYYSMFDIRRTISAQRLKEWFDFELLNEDVFASRSTLHTNLYGNTEPRVMMDKLIDRHWKPMDDVNREGMPKEWPPRDRIAPMRAEIERLQARARDMQDSINHLFDIVFELRDENEKLKEDLKSQKSANCKNEKDEL